MNALTWFLIAAAGWAVAAAIALASSRASVAVRVSSAVSALAGAAAVAGGVSALWWGSSRVISAGTAVVAGTLQLQANSLAGVFAALLGLTAVALAAYAPRYHQASRGSAAYLAVFNLALLACLAVLTAANVVISGWRACSQIAKRRSASRASRTVCGRSEPASSRSRR